MAGHSKWAQIKRQKEVTDAKKSKIFTKLVQLITLESRKAGGDVRAPGLRAAIEKARESNMPNDNIDRAVKKGSSGGVGDLEELIYEAYGPGGTALIIAVLTDNRNKSAQDVKHILSLHGGSLALPKSALWAFEHQENGDWVPGNPIPVSLEDQERLSALVEALEESDQVQSVYTNASTPQS